MFLAPISWQGWEGTTAEMIERSRLIAATENICYTRRIIAATALTNNPIGHTIGIAKTVKP